MKLTKEHFDQVTRTLATRAYVEAKFNEVIFHLVDTMATIEEGFGPEERLLSLEQKINRLQEHLHIEV